MDNWILLNKILNLAIERGQPLNILEDPRYTAYKATRTGEYTGYFIATIGNISVSFCGFQTDELIELYANLKAGLESEETYIKASNETWERAKRTYSNAESSK